MSRSPTDGATRGREAEHPLDQAARLVTDEEARAELEQLEEHHPVVQRYLSLLGRLNRLPRGLFPAEAPGPDPEVPDFFPDPEPV